MRGFTTSYQIKIQRIRSSDLTNERNRYRFSLKENLNKRFADRRATVKDPDIDRRVRNEIQKVFPGTEGVEKILFPNKSGQIPDRAIITLIILGPDQSIQENPKIRDEIESMTREHGKSAHTYKSALLWAVPESGGQMCEEARKLIAWENIRDERLKLDEIQSNQLMNNIKKSKRDLTESVWRSYKNIRYLDKNNQIDTIDLGMITSSAAESMTKYILSFLRQKDIINKDVAPRYLVRNWPPAFTEWSTKAVRDAFFASPQFPRLLCPDTIKETIARGVCEGHIAYVAKSAHKGYDLFLYKKTMDADEVEISDDVFILSSEEAEKHIEPPTLTSILISPAQVRMKPGVKQTFTVNAMDQFGRPIHTGTLEWSATGFLSRLCGGKLLTFQLTQFSLFLSRLCGGKLTNLPP